MDPKLVQKSQTKSNTVFLTPQGLAMLRTELHFLQNEKRTELSERLQLAREMDDTDENAEYDAAIDEQMMVESRISELENILAHARSIDQSVHISRDIVEIGVTVLIDIEGKTEEYMVVGKTEANPSQKRISNESPIGMALMGSKKGEIVTVATPLKSYQCKVIEIK